MNCNSIFGATNDKRNRILKLQKDLEEKTITIKELTKEDFMEIKNLYLEQINYLKTDVNIYKNKLEGYKRKACKILK